MNQIIKKIRFKFMRFAVSNDLAGFFLQFYQWKAGKFGQYGGKSLMVDNACLSQHIKELKFDGFTELDFRLQEELINQITSNLHELRCHDPYRPQHGYFKIEDVPSDTHTAHYLREE